MTAATTLPAQARRALLGTVVTGDGTPLLGATVHCAVPAWGDSEGRAIEHLVADVDARGRFVFKVRPCTQYCIWAIGPLDGEGQVRRVSPVVWAASGKLVALRATKEHPEANLTVVGLDAWQDAAPFRVRLAPAKILVDDATIALSDEGTCKLPPSPDARMQVDLLDKDGEVLLSRSMSVAGNSRLTVPPPQDVPLLVVDAEGKPVAGATIRQRLYSSSHDGSELGVRLPPRDIWRRIGATDAQGRLVARISHRKPVFEENSYPQANFLAEKAGYESAFSGVGNQVYWNGKCIEEAGEEVRFTLAAAKPRSGRILCNEQTPMGNQALTAGLSLRVRNANGNGWISHEMAWPLTTDAEGRFEVPQAVGLGDWISLTMHGPQLAQRLVQEPQLRQTPMRFLALHPRKVVGDKPLEIDLSQLHQLELTFATSQGSPAGNTSVMLLSAVNEFGVHGMLPRAVTDIGGNVSLQVEPGEWHLFARRGATMYSQRLTLDQDVELTPSLVPMATMRGRVVDADGKPVAGAKFDCRGSSHEFGADRDEALERIASACNWTWIAQAITDDNGEFACTWLDIPGTSYRGMFQLGDRKSELISVQKADGQTIKLH